MGRYSVPIFDHDNGDDIQAMDWTAIPDDEPTVDPTGDAHHHVSRDNIGDSRSLVRYNTTTSGTNSQCQDSSDDFNDSNRDESIHHPGTTNNSYREGHVQEATITAHGDNTNCEALLRVAEQYMEQSNYYLEQQHLDQKRRKIIRTIMILVVALVAIVLKRHAPPPPPIWNQSPSVATTFSPDSDSSLKDSTSDPYINESIPGVTHHETWDSYSRDLLHLIHRALTYGMSVAWYAISNAFCYAIEEVREVFIAILYGNGSDENSSMWMNWKEKLVLFGTTLIQVQTAKESQHNSQSNADIQHDDNVPLNKISECPIRIPAANNLYTHLPRGATSHDITNDERTMEGWSTEEFLRQTIGTSLSPQNLAIKVISEGIDTWGETLVRESPIALVHKIATATSTNPEERYVDDEILSKWILPPSTGFLLVGPEGVGKLHAARRIARLFLGHCLEASSVSSGNGTPIRGLDSVLEVIAGDYTHDDQEVHPAKELIVNYIHGRKGLGSVITIHHIELLPTWILSDISQVLSGETDTLSYTTPEEELVEASCDGSVFIFTSKQWGTKSLFQHIQRNNGPNGMRRESLISSIRWEVDSHLDYWTKLAAHANIAPFFPFEIEDLSSILQNRVQTLNQKYQGLHWKRLEVSHATIKHAVGMDHVEYLDLYKQNDGSGEEDRSVVALLTFSTSGAHALDNNALWQTLRTRLVSGTRRRPWLTLKVDLDNNSKETVFRWCDRENGGVGDCEEEWRSVLT